MKKTILLAAALLLTVGAASAQTTQEWTTGWDNLHEPLDFAHSNIKWSLAAGRKLTVAFTLVGATANKLYQVGVHIFCTTAPGRFRRFPTNPASGNCLQQTRQGVTKSVASVEVGVVTTDLHGKGSFKVTVGPIASSTYEVEFNTRNGAGCNLISGGGNGGAICEVDFQSPGPFGTTTAIIVP